MVLICRTVKTEDKNYCYTERRFTDSSKDLSYEQEASDEHGKNRETLEQIYDGKDRRLTGLSKKRKVAAVLCCVQGDAAAKVGAEVDGGGGAPKTGRCEEDEVEGHEGEKEMTLRSYL